MTSRTPTIPVLLQRNGFQYLGPITVVQGRVRFPTEGATGGGMYFLTFNAGGHYVGETSGYRRRVGYRLRKNPSSPGRFNDYSSPAIDVFTELVINAMLLDGQGGHIYIREQPDADPSDEAEWKRKQQERLQIEADLVAQCLAADIPIWNAGGNRCERTYQDKEGDQIARMLGDAIERYADALTPERRKRLQKLLRRLERNEALVASLAANA